MAHADIEIQRIAELEHGGAIQRGVFQRDRRAEQFVQPRLRGALRIVLHGQIDQRQIGIDRGGVHLAHAGFVHGDAQLERFEGLHQARVRGAQAFEIRTLQTDVAADVIEGVAFVAALMMKDARLSRCQR